MFYGFLLGCLCSMLFDIYFRPRLQKKHVGEMRHCQSCPYREKHIHSVVSGGDDDEE